MMIFSLVAMIGLEKCCITSACLQWLCHSGEQTVARGPLVFICVCFLFVFCVSVFLFFFVKLIFVSELLSASQTIQNCYSFRRLNPSPAAPRYVLLSQTV